MNTSSDLTNRARLIALANREKLLNREADNRTVNKAVREVVKQIKPK